MSFVIMMKCFCLFEKKNFLVYNNIINSYSRKMKSNSDNRLKKDKEPLVYHILVDSTFNTD